MAHVEARAGELGEHRVARDDRRLGDRRPAGEAELGRQRPLVHDGAAREVGILRVLRHDRAERRGVLERAAHELGVGDALPVVAEHRHSGGAAREHRHVGETLPREADRDGADRAHGREPGLLAEPVHLLDDRRVSATGFVLAIANTHV